MLKSVKWILPVSLWILSAGYVKAGDDGVSNSSSPLELSEFRWASGFCRQLILDFQPSITGYYRSDDPYPGTQYNLDRYHEDRYRFFFRSEFFTENISDAEEKTSSCSFDLNPSFNNNSSSNRFTYLSSSGSSRFYTFPRLNFNSGLTGSYSRLVYPGVIHLGYSVSGAVRYGYSADSEIHRSEDMSVSSVNPAIREQNKARSRGDWISSIFSADLDPGFTIGAGRIRDATPLFIAKQMIDDLRDRRLLRNVPTQEDMRTLAILCGTNLVDYWDVREYEIERISRIFSFLGEKGYLLDTSPESVLRIRDTLAYFPEIPRRHGSQIRLIFTPGLSAQSRSRSYKWKRISTVAISSNDVTLTVFSSTNMEWRGERYSALAFSPGIRLAYDVDKPLSANFQFDQSYSLSFQPGTGWISRSVSSNDWLGKTQNDQTIWSPLFYFDQQAVVSFSWIPSTRWVLGVVSDTSGYFVTMFDRGVWRVYLWPVVQEELSFNASYSVRKGLVYDFRATLDADVDFGGCSVWTRLGWNLSGGLSYRFF